MFATLWPCGELGTTLKSLGECQSIDTFNRLQPVDVEKFVSATEALLNAKATRCDENT